jgi:hypothetical protein
MILLIYKVLPIELGQSRNSVDIRPKNYLYNLVKSKQCKAYSVKRN